MHPEFVSVNDLSIHRGLYSLLATEILPAAGIGTGRFFAGLSSALRVLGPRNRDLLARRQQLQESIDGWHAVNPSLDMSEYRRFLSEVGYLVPPVSDFSITTEGVDDELCAVSAPQLVVPVTNARYSLNAVNARWGSLYDALYGTDALGSRPPGGPYDPDRGRAVIDRGRGYLDAWIPLAGASHRDVASYSVEAGSLVARLADGRRAGLREPALLAGVVGDPYDPSSVLFQHHGLIIDLQVDRNHPVGATDKAGLRDIVLEAAVTAIIDFEDSVSTVDGDDKAAAYRNWFGLMTGELRAEVIKDGRSFIRQPNADRSFITREGSESRLRARSLLLARVVGHLTTTDAVLDSDGHQVPEGILDTFVVSAAALADRTRPIGERNSRHGSIYLVKPKMHGPEEVQLAVDTFAAVERTLGLPERTLKIGVMDEERRTSATLDECIRVAADRIVFINTGFLDRTGDEIHTSMRAGPVIRKADMKGSAWIRAYENLNVSSGLRAGFAGKAQIGKGMWAMPDLMADMMDQKIAQPLAGASTGWVPSPTAATLHVTHYHDVDVAMRQKQLRDEPRPDIDELLSIPVSRPRWTSQERREEIENNIQGILGYVVRWVDQGIGCSKVPDIFDVALMEDRATCRISSQHVANWLLHGVVSASEVEDTFRRMAKVVDRQNADDPIYRSMADTFDGPAFLCARALVLEGIHAPSGYTEPALHAFRRRRKELDRNLDTASADRREGTLAI